jgi:predicted RNase H-like nuclease (RuvC/YqgF family)
MKIPLSIIFGLSLLVPACNGIELSRVEAASEEQSTTTNTQAQQREREEEQAQQRDREEYVKSIQAKLDEYKRKIDGLEARTSTMSGPAKDDFRKMIEQLRIQKESIASRLSYVKSASPDAFSLIKAELDSAFAKLESSYQEVSRKLEITPPSPSKDQQK